jgi:dienelactone hydrolase
MYKYFEKNYMWSLAVLRMIASGAILGEVNRVAKKLIDAQESGPNGDYEAWYTGWHGLGEQLRVRGDEAAAAGHTETAYACFSRAALYLFWSEAFLPPEDKRKLQSLNEMLSAFSLAADHSSGRLEVVDVPYEDTTLPAYFLRAAGDGPAPCVVIFGGLDSAKEELTGTASYFVARGISALVVEGPGQGVALKIQGLSTRFDYEVPAGAAYDYAASRDDVDETRIALCGISMGGYYASRAAAFEKRFKACVIVGAQYDYRATWVRRMDIKPGAPTPAPSSHLFDVLGVSNWDEALEALTPFTLAGVAEKIECPILVTHGELDKQILVEDAHSLFAEIGSKDKTLRIFTDEEGGSGHSHVDCKEPAYPFLSDWLAAKLEVSH